jgi:senataxin
VSSFSSGRQQFVDYILELDLVFDTCIVDEAAQATEPATLIPLRYGCRTLVLVGDPRQLPATVLSQAAKDARLDRSLFERLEEAGHAKVMTIKAIPLFTLLPIRVIRLD